MQRIVVAAKAGADQPWLADAAAEPAGQSGAVVDVVGADGVDIEAYSTVPRSEAAGPAREAAERMAGQLREQGVETEPHTLHGQVVRSVLLFAFVVVNIGVIIPSRSSGRCCAWRSASSSSSSMASATRACVTATSPTQKRS